MFLPEFFLRSFPTMPKLESFGLYWSSRNVYSIATPRAGVNMIGVSFGQSPIARIECKGDLATIGEHVATIRAEHSSQAFKIIYKHERKPRGWDASDLKWKTDNLPE